MTVTALARTFATLRAFTRERPAVEWCDLCAAALDSAHDHLLASDTRQLRCACAACALVLGGAPGTRWTRVPRRVQRLVDLRLPDETWQMLALPVELAFLVRRGAQGRVVAVYPSPGGPVEASVPPAAWDGLVAANLCLAGLRVDVEALLVNRTGARRDHYLLSIDECYRLVGLLRRHWRGFSGGGDVQERIARFFAELDAAAGGA